MDLTCRGDGLEQLDERRAAGKRRETEDREASGRSKASVPARRCSSRPGKTLGRARRADVGADEAPQMRLPPVVGGKGATGAVDVVAAMPGQHQLGPAHRVTIEEVGEPPGTPEPGGPRRQAA